MGNTDHYCFPSCSSHITEDLCPLHHTMNTLPMPTYPPLAKGKIPEHINKASSVCTSMHPWTHTHTHTHIHTHTLTQTHTCTHTHTNTHTHTHTHMHTRSHAHAHTHMFNDIIDRCLLCARSCKLSYILVTALAHSYM